MYRMIARPGTNQQEQEQWRGSKLQHKNYCFQFCTPPSCHCRVFPTHLIRITFVLLLSYEKGRAMNQQSTSIVTIATQIRKRARSPPTWTYPVLRTVKVDVLFSIYLTPINFLLLIFAYSPDRNKWGGGNYQNSDFFGQIFDFLSQINEKIKVFGKFERLFYT